MTTLSPPPADAPAPALLDVRAVAALLDCSQRHVYRLADADRMPKPVKLGALIRWPNLTGNPMTGVRDWVSAGCPDCAKGGNHDDR